MFDSVTCFKDVSATYHVGKFTESELSHEFANFLSNEVHEVNRVLRIAREVLTEFRVLRRNTNRAGVEVANAHHDATE